MTLTAQEHKRVTDAVAKAERGTAGEIVTVVAERSDGYTDVALAWSALAALLALCTLAIVPDPFLALYDRLSGGWVHDWTPRQICSLAAGVAALSFGAMMLLQMIPALRFFLVPTPIKAKRVHERALKAFRIGAEHRTAGGTGILIYLSMREHRAEILGDAPIASVVSGDTWSATLEALLSGVRQGDVAGGMCAAVERVGAILAEHFPRQEDDVNELPDRLIEV